MIAKDPPLYGGFYLMEITERHQLTNLLSRKKIEPIEKKARILN